jgi:DNA adenine methylase
MTIAKVHHKPIVSYYGGKQKLVSKILPHFPQHTVYAEPFCGGATMLFAKPYLHTGNNNNYREVINDVNDDLITMYRVAKEQPEQFFARIDATLYSQSDDKKARKILKERTSNDPLDIAWAVYLQCNMSFANCMFGGWGTSVKNHNEAITFNNRKARLKAVLERIAQTHISNEDALACLKRWDSPQTLFYIDPPYIDANQGHYAGYTREDFTNLIDTLKNIKGSFVLSCYPNDVVPADWTRVDFAAAMSAAKRKDLDKKRTESIWIKDSNCQDPYILDLYKKQRLCFPELFPNKQLEIACVS